MVIMLVCGDCGSHFQNGRCEFSMSHISANNRDRNLMLLSISMFSGSEKPNRIKYNMPVTVFGWQLEHVR